MKYTMVTNEKFVEEIRYRGKLSAKTRAKLTDEEKVWLQTHSVYSEKYGYPFLRAAVIDITPNVECKLNISLVEKNVPVHITPTLKIPMGKGYLAYDGQIREPGSGEIEGGKRVAMLSTANDYQHPEVNLAVLSELGKFVVFFHSVTLPINQKHPAFGRGSSCQVTERLIPSTTMPYFAMKCELTNDNMLRFYCSISQQLFTNDYIFEIRQD